MKITKTELREMIRDVIQEELQRRHLKEASFDDPEMQRERQKFQDWLHGRKMIDEDAIMSTLSREINDCLGNKAVPGKDKKSNTTYSGTNLRSERTTLNSGLSSVYTYRLADGLPDKTFTPSAAFAKGYQDLKNFKIDHHADCLKFEHKLYCEKDHDGYTLFYQLTIIPDWNKCVFWSNGYPDPRRGQRPEDVRG